jgi:hypothetical protein
MRDRIGTVLSFTFEFILMIELVVRAKQFKDLFTTSILLNFLNDCIGNFGPCDFQGAVFWVC